MPTSHAIRTLAGLASSNSELILSDEGISIDTPTTEKLIMGTDSSPDMGDIVCESGMLYFFSFAVFTGCCINRYNITRFNKRRNLNHQTSLESCVF